MFDLTSSKLLILGIVALLVVGPKDLPMLLRTIGKYVGIIRKQATEFRAQFDEAMRDTELDQIRKDVAAIKAEATGALRDVTSTVDTHVADAKREVEKAAEAVEAPRLATYDETVKVYREQGQDPPPVIADAAAMNETAQPVAPVAAEVPAAPSESPAPISIVEAPHPPAERAAS